MAWYYAKNGKPFGPINESKFYDLIQRGNDSPPRSCLEYIYGGRVADDESVTASEAITRSKEMMQGHKGKSFCLYLRFFWWSLLCILTFGIGYLWLGPYVQIAKANFYDDIKGTARSGDVG